MLYTLLALTTIFNALPNKARARTFDRNATEAMHLIENKGQVRDQSNKPRKGIDYTVHSNGLQVFIGPATIHYQFSNIANGKVTSHRIDVKLLGADINARATSEEENGYKEYHYTKTEKKISNAFNKVTYKNIYPNIDWVLYTKGDILKYDFIIHPGGNPKDIKLQYEGATASALREDGSLAVSSPMGTIIENSPYSFEKETGKTIPSKFKLEKNILSFDYDTYNGTLVIDPTLSWSTYYGGSDNDYCNKIVNDPAGNSYIIGTTGSFDNIATIGSFQSSYNAIGDVFVVKFNSSGARVWATYLGGSDGDYGLDITLTANNIYLTGYTASTDFPTTTGAFQTNNNGGFHDAFITKMDLNGQMVWSSYFGGTGDDRGYGISTDNSNNIVLTGLTSSNGMATNGSFQPAIGGSADAYLAKFTSAGNQLWCTYCGGNAYDQCAAVTCDANGDIYIAGATGSTSNISTTGTAQAVKSGQDDGFVVKYNTAGQRIWGTYYGGSFMDGATSILVDSFGYVCVAGTTSSTNNISTGNSFQQSYGGGNTDVFLLKLRSNGTRKWATYIGGNGIEKTPQLSSDTAGNIIISSSTNSTNNFVATSNAFQLNSNGDYDCTIMSFTNSGNRIMGTYFGGGLEDGLSGSSCTNGYVHICGNTYSQDYISNVNSFQQFINSSNDGFISTLRLDTSISIVQPMTDTILCLGEGFQLYFATMHSFLNGNLFTAELSDNNGSFQTSTVIGTLSATTSGIISCLIPGGLPQSTGYKLRIVSTSPSKISDTIRLTLNSIVTPTATISANPGTNISPGVTVTFSSSVTNGGISPSFQWQKNGVDIPGATNATYATNNLADGDDITVVLTSSEPCVTTANVTSNELTITLNLSVNHVAEDGAISIYPNPVSSGRIFITNLSETNTEIYIYNSMGAKVIQQMVLSTNPSIDISSLPKGYYTVRVATKNGNVDLPFMCL